jgi:murein DD-endopeptidase MepM/ murein hydrolase activator NlpD
VRPYLLLLMMLCCFAPVSIAQETPTETPVFTPVPEDVTPTAIPRPVAVKTLTQEGVTLELYFEEIKQGRAALLKVYGENVSGARARFSDLVTDFFPIEGEGFYGFIAASMEQSAREYDLEVYAIMEDESRVTFQTPVSVVQGGFIGQTLEIPQERAYLIDPEIERTEFARLDSIFQNITDEVMWDSGEIDFQFPINSNITSQFGAVRVLNGTVETRHTGWDLQAATGTPVMAMAAGKVAFAGTMDIRGNVVILDHGYGVFSVYAHLSVMNVTRGQRVAKGQILGMSGNTGRSSGPHLHWEINVNREWVDSVDFLQMWIPG